MKKIISGFILVILVLSISSCGTIFGGHISKCQSRKPLPGQPKRQIRPFALIGDILAFPLMAVPGVPIVIDFIDGGIYKPCTGNNTDSIDNAYIAKRKRDDSLDLISPAKYLNQNPGFSVSTDILQYALYQPNIGVEYRVNKRIAFGMNLGYVIPEPLFTVNPFANGQYIMPGNVYTGEALRLNFKYIPGKPNSYWCAQAVIKSLWYNNVSFTDESMDEYWATYTLNEKSTVLGLEALHGDEWAIRKSRIYIDLFYGLGIHSRFRTFTVIQSSSNYPPNSYLPEGTYKGYTWYPTTVVGFRLGFNFSHKTASPN